MRWYEVTIDRGQVERWLVLAQSEDDAINKAFDEDMLAEKQSDSSDQWEPQVFAELGTDGESFWKCPMCDEELKSPQTVFCGEECFKFFLADYVYQLKGEEIEIFESKDAIALTQIIKEREANGLARW